MVWGRNTLALAETFDDTTDPIVFVALVPGTGLHGRGTSAIRRACAKQGRELHVLRFADRRSVYVDPSRDPQVEFATVRRGPPRTG